MRHNYMPAELAKNTAKAIGRDLPISPKVSIEISNYLRGKKLDDAIATLERVLEKRQAIPYVRFPNGAGHKPGKGITSGRYPMKASTEFLKLLRNAKANAANINLTGDLVVSHIAAQRASEPFRAYAKERISFKRSHVEVIVSEAPKKVEKPNTQSKYSKAGKAAHAAKKTGVKPAAKPAKKAPAKEEVSEE